MTLIIYAIVGIILGLLGVYVMERTIVERAIKSEVPPRYPVTPLLYRRRF